MGGACTKYAGLSRVGVGTDDKQLKNRKLLDRFYAEGSLIKEANSEVVEFRFCLDDSLSYRAMLVFSRSKNLGIIMRVWSALNDLRFVSRNDLREAKTAYAAYIATPPLEMSSEALGFDVSIAAESKVNIDRLFSLVPMIKTNFALRKGQILNNLKECFRAYQWKILLVLYDHVYLPFKETESYLELNKLVNEGLNMVTQEDFIYLEQLGRGKYGISYKCIKKSTGQVVTMKITRKKSLLNHRNVNGVIRDFKLYAACNHPFIMEYMSAFQTEAYAILVLSYCELGSLHKVLSLMPNHIFPAENVLFYAAEMVSALGYLHDRGVIYCDLNPRNVMVAQDGHIKLVDFSSAARYVGELSGKSYDSSSGILGSSLDSSLVSPGTHNAINAHCFADDTQPLETITMVHSGADSSKDVRDSCYRSATIIGTEGYLAPEALFLKNCHLCGKFSLNLDASIDWWSLGATLYTLSCGSMPYKQSSQYYGAYVDCGQFRTTTKDSVASTNNLKESTASIGGLVRLAVEETRKVVDGDNVSVCESIREMLPDPTAELVFDPTKFNHTIEDFLRRLLDFNPKRRIGSGPNGFSNLIAHPYFASIDWKELDMKNITPPLFGCDDSVTNNSRKQVEWNSSYAASVKLQGMEQILDADGCGDWKHDVIVNENQDLFKNWDFISAQCLISELLIRNERKDELRYDIEKLKRVFFF